MIRILLLITLLASSNCFAQQLWGSLKPGPNAVGFKVIRERDNARGGRQMLVSVWYPAKSSASAKAVLFKDYVAAGVFNQSFSAPSENEKKAAYDDFRKTLQLPFIGGGATITDEAYNRVLDLPTAAKWNLPEATGKHPAVLMSSEPESLSVTAEYLASNGFVVAAVNAPWWDQQQPADSLLYVRATADMLWLLQYTQKIKSIDQAKLSCLGFGGGIQSSFYLTMKTDKIRKLVNLEGGVFGPRSLTDKSIEYHPEKVKTPLLHIVTQSQRNEDDERQMRALVNTTIYKAGIQNDSLRHHDFSIFGPLLNKGFNALGTLGEPAEQTFAAAHKMILEFLSPGSFVVDRRYRPFINLEIYGQEPGLVLYEPGMDKVLIESSKIFRAVNDTSLVFDIYYPEGFDKKRELPVVVFVNGVGSMDAYRWKIYKDWAKLTAAHGMIAVNYQARRNHALDDSEFFLDYLSAHAQELSLDKEKIGLWACSANVGTGLPLAMQETRRSIKALAVYYGMVGGDLPRRQDLELQIVRAGLDFQDLNAGIDDFVRTALLEDLHFELVNYPEGQHAFDAFDPTPRSREIILQTIEFFRRTLSKEHPVPATTVLTNSRIWAGIIDQKRVDETLSAWKEAVAIYRKMNHSQWYNHVIDERNLNQVGYRLIDDGRLNDALKVFIANQEQFPESANAHDALGDIYEKLGDKTKAVANSKLALKKLAKQTGLQPQFRDAIRKSAEEKIKRLK